MLSSSLFKGNNCKPTLKKSTPVNIWLQLQLKEFLSLWMSLFFGILLTVKKRLKQLLNFFLKTKNILI
jgi:hypothetical protein